MHLVCLGVMRRLLLVWTKRKRETKMSAAQISEVDVQLDNFRAYIPSVFVRKPRPLTELDKWKATEFKQFLLYKESSF